MVIQTPLQMNVGIDPKGLRLDQLARLGCYELQEVNTYAHMSSRKPGQVVRIVWADVFYPLIDIYNSLIDKLVTLETSLREGTREKEKISGLGGNSEAGAALIAVSKHVSACYSSAQMTYVKQKRGKS